MGTPSSTMCALGCITDSEVAAHCGRMVPTHVPEAQLALGGLSALAVGAGEGLIFHTDTGQIQRRSGMGLVEVRPAMVGTVNGIDFALVSQTGGPPIGSFAVARFEVAALGVVRTVGDAALAILSQQAVVIDGTIDVGATELDGGPGGYDSETGPGVGGAADGSGLRDPGGGGGGFGGLGGAGDDDGVLGGGGGSGGLTYGDALLTVLQGGSGGGRGDNGPGGGGGGAIQITSLVSITLSGTITAPGDGGRPAREGAGGGGAGGAIFLEAPQVVWASPGILAVNGGGGGGGNGPLTTSTPGERGRASTSRAAGGVSSVGDGRGGEGAAGAENTGGAGSGFVPSGGGGGGGGRVRVLTFAVAAPGALVVSPAAARSDGRITVR